MGAANSRNQCQRRWLILRTTINIGSLLVSTFRLETYLRWHNTLQAPEASRRKSDLHWVRVAPTYRLT